MKKIKYLSLWKKKICKEFMYVDKSQGRLTTRQAATCTAYVKGDVVPTY